MPDFTTAAVAMIGLGVGIDYALFIVTRYRENLAAGLDPERSVVRAVDTAGRAVLFAGTTVVISVLGLLLMKTSVIRGVADRRSRSACSSRWSRRSRCCPRCSASSGATSTSFGLPHRKRREATSAGVGLVPLEPRASSATRGPPLIVGLVVLLVLAVPLLSMRLGFSDAGNRPTSDTTRQAYDLLSPTASAPASTARCSSPPRRPNGATDLARAQPAEREAATTPRASRSPTPPQANAEGTVAIMQVFPTTDPQDEATADLVDRLRDDVVPAAPTAPTST